MRREDLQQPPKIVRPSVALFEKTWLLSSQLRPAPVETPTRMRSLHLTDQTLDPGALLRVGELLPRRPQHPRALPRPKPPALALASPPTNPRRALPGGVQYCRTCAAGQVHNIHW